MDWQRLFQRITDLVIDTPALGFVRRNLPPEALARRRLSSPSASEDEIRRVETKLGIRLPPSYREFVGESNGFLCFPGLGRLFALSEVGWFSDLESEWCEILEEGAESWVGIPRSTEYPNDDWPIPYARDVLQVGKSDDGNVVLLNPRILSDENEWEAYSLVSHGSSCYRSFGDLMLAQLEQEEEYYKNNPEDPLASLRPLLDFTSRARAGQTLEVKEAIEQRYRQGETEAAVPLAEIAAFEWNWQACSSYAVDAMVHDPQASRDLRLPCLWVLCASRLDRWDGAETILELLPSPSAVTAAVYHRRIASVRRMIVNREWTGLSGRLDPLLPLSEEPDAEKRRQAFEKYCLYAQTRCPRNWKTPERADCTRWTFAISYNLPDVAMEIAHRRPDERLPDDTFELGRCYAEKGRPDDAWKAILHALRYWSDGGAITRVAPVELLIDRAFEGVMTPERCMQVLATGKPPLVT